MEVILLGLLGAAAIAGLLIYFSFAWGFVAMKFYSWFILSIPALEKLPAFTFMEWVGISFFIGVVFRGRRGSPIKEEYKDNSNKTFLLEMLTPAFALGAGWLLKSLFF